jgi:CRISPR-associated RAMP protein (TIGR02581 family)
MPHTEPIFSFAALHNRLVVRGNLVALTALRIGAGRSSNVIGNDLPVLRDALNAPFVPGASLKGAFRARVESLIRAVQDGQAHDLLMIEVHMRDKIIPIQEEVQRLVQAHRIINADQVLSERIWKHSTLIDLTFGAPWIASRIFFKDALVDRTLWFDQYEIRNGVAINRDTETAEQGLLYDYEVVPAGVRFNFELVIENAAPWQLGMVLLALRPWQNGDVQIGGFRSRGLGHIQLTDMLAHYTAIEGEDTAARVDAILSLLGHGDTHATSNISLDAGSEPLHTWIEAFKQALIDPTTVIAEGATFNA